LVNKQAVAHPLLRNMLSHCEVSAQTPLFRQVVVREAETLRASVTAVVSYVMRERALSAVEIDLTDVEKVRGWGCDAAIDDPELRDFKMPIGSFMETVVAMHPVAGN
jgi:hypothetical protein